MPAALPGDTAVNNTTANPSAGRPVIFNPLSGPKGSPLDRDVQVPFGSTPGGSGYPASGNASTGGLSTGIGYGASDVINGLAAGIFLAGFNDNNIPGEVDTYSAGGPPPVVASSAINSTRMYIGGGRSNADGGPNPYTAGVAIVGAGNGGSRDGGSSSPWTGFPMKMVTVPSGTPTVANGAAVETGWANRSGGTILANQSVYGSSATQLSAAS